MKTRKNRWKSICMITALLLAMTLPAKAQMTDNGYANVDWQYNFPTGKAFAGDEYIPRTVLSLSPSESLSTDQQHTAFRLPFGVAGRYAWNRGGDFQPYIAIKAGAQYAKLTSDFNVFEDRDKTWGFYVSPEIGLHIFPWAYGPGLHIAAYYDYGTNQGKVLTYDINGMNNAGLRIGISF